MAITIDGSNGIDIGAGNLTFPDSSVQSSSGQPILMTAVTASGTSVDFTGIPSWVKRITVMFSGLSTNGASQIQLQLGDAGGIETTGYLGGGSTAGTQALLASGFQILNSGSAASLGHGACVISLLDPSANTWVASGTTALSSTAQAGVIGGSKSLSDVLTQLRIATVNGIDTFDAGSINIMYE